MRGEQENYNTFPIKKMKKRPICTLVICPFHTVMPVRPQMNFLVGVTSLRNAYFGKLLYQI